MLILRVGTGRHIYTSFGLKRETQCQMAACSNCKNLKYSSLYFEKVQRSWSKMLKVVSIRQIMSKLLIPEHD